MARRTSSARRPHSTSKVPKASLSTRGGFKNGTTSEMTFLPTPAVSSPPRDQTVLAKSAPVGTTNSSTSTRSPSTQWSNVEQDTSGPYELSVKENGCIIFFSGLEDGTLLVCSKHSTGARSDVATKAMPKLVRSGSRDISKVSARRHETSQRR